MPNKSMSSLQGCALRCSHHSAHPDPKGAAAAAEIETVLSLKEALVDFLSKREGMARVRCSVRFGVVGREWASQGGGKSAINSVGRATPAVRPNGLLSGGRWCPPSAHSDRTHAAEKLVAGGHPSFRQSLVLALVRLSMMIVRSYVWPVPERETARARRP